MEGAHLVNKRVPGREHALISTHVHDEEDKPIFIERRKVPEYVNEEFWQYYEIYRMSELFGLPNAPVVGWADEVLDIVEAVAAIRTEFKVIESERYEDADRGS